MNHVFKHVLLIVALVLAVINFFWIYYIAPAMLQLPSDFTYSANLISYDNFYDPAIQDFIGKTQSHSTFEYHVVGQQPGIILVANHFEVIASTGTPIIQIERQYGVNQITGQHVSGFGDQDRIGYLFAPKHLRPGQNFVYWHVSYNLPAEMHYKETEEINGLTVFHYQTTLNPDQTAELDYLPNVGETLGVNLDVVLDLWVEPLTGQLVKYQDKAIGYYYDLGSRQRLQPWNAFSNRFDDASITQQVRLVRQEHTLAILVEYVVPAILALLLVLVLSPFVVTHWYIVKNLWYNMRNHVS
jgi:hypothetical protein